MSRREPPPPELSASCRQRVLIFIVAYNAQATLAEVINRIVIDDEVYDVEVLIIDDASRDSTFEIGLSLREQCRFPLAVLQNPTNQGYGGNQKLGYHYAIAHGYDAVVLLHGDGQYAPEKLQDLVEPVARGEADAVFGSRMMIRGGALRGGMPLYKYIGNKILTAFQNRVLGLELSEFHSGYRVYSVRGLAKIPFEYNANDFHFDTEIIIQLLAARLRILEVPIPTFYGDEISHVDGLKYAYQVVRSTTAYWLHRKGIFYRYNFDVGDSGYELKVGYPSSHTVAIERVPPGSRVVDLGCGPGHVAELLVREKQCRVIGVDREEVENSAFEAFHALDLATDPLPSCLGEAEVVLMLDVLETLPNPEEFLYRLRQKISAGSCRLVITTPNIGFVIPRLMLLLGQFNYGKRGILDKKHKRLFTVGSLRRLLTQAGFVVRNLEGIPAPFPKALGDRFFSRLLLRANALALSVSKRLFAYQIYLEATALATVETLIAETERHSRQS